MSATIAASSSASMAPRTWTRSAVRHQSASSSPPMYAEPFVVLARDRLSRELVRRDALEEGEQLHLVARAACRLLCVRRSALVEAGSHQLGHRSEAARRRPARARPSCAAADRTSRRRPRRRPASCTGSCRASARRRSRSPACVRLRRPGVGAHEVRVRLAVIDEHRLERVEPGVVDGASPSPSAGGSAIAFVHPLRAGSS